MTVVHGLTSAPDVCIVKEREALVTGLSTLGPKILVSDEAHVGYFNLSGTPHLLRAASI